MEVTIPVSDTPSFASTREALDMLHAVIGYLSTDAGEMAAEAQAECLQELEQLDAVKTATRTRVLGGVHRGSKRSTPPTLSYSPPVWLNRPLPRTPGPRRVAGPAQRYPVAESRAQEKRLSSSRGSCSEVNQATSVSSSSLTAGEPSMIVASYTAVT